MGGPMDPTDSVPNDGERGKQVEVEAELAKLTINFQETKHPPVPTIEEMLKHVTANGAAICKNLLLKDKKNPSKIFLLTAHADSPVNMKLLNKKLGCGNLRFADEETLLDCLSVSQGSVTPLAVFYDREKKVEFLMDDKLKQYTNMMIHPMHNRSTLQVAVADVLRYCQTFDHSVKWIDLAESSCSEKPAEDPSTSPLAADGSSSLLGITVKKLQDFPEWYTQVVVRSEMMEYYDISGCYIIREWAFFIWEVVSRFFDDEIKKMGVRNAYFPMFVSKARLEAEKEHVAGFSPEVAWVTRYGDQELAEPIAIRPTSETIMYPAYAKWIRSHRDLPLKLNQWNTVVRWEFKQPTPFIRTREFLWQEGHTAHATEEEALTLVYDILELYSRWYQECLAVPVVKGVKSEGEKFAGGKLTTTIEGFIQENGRGIQAATSHLLGTSFAKMFDIKYEDEKGEKQLVHQTSWGCTTRSLGVMIMVHGDDKGLVLPPRVASIQTIIIPITYKEENMKEQVDRCELLKKSLTAVGLRAEIDDRTNYTPGWKYNHWEVKGVPIRMELGPRDMEKESVRLVRRDTGEKVDVAWADIAAKVPLLLTTIQADMLTAAKAKLDGSIVKVTEFSQVMDVLNAKKLVLAPWCEDIETEALIKKETQRLSATPVATAADASSLTGAMKPLCIPLEQPEMPEGTKCFFSDKPAKRWCLFGRSY
eukprot:GHVS01041533.1.p1 GENE.GHVS01041533.1~~GHVS01041533.1.p1  ORF type:complete len:704 (+),score=120.51 GHVS01041533.1:150-2261(+)